LAIQKAGVRSMASLRGLPFFMSISHLLYSNIQLNNRFLFFLCQYFEKSEMTECHYGAKQKILRYLPKDWIFYYSLNGLLLFGYRPKIFDNDLTEFQSSPRDVPTFVP
jgi:hypothetical protein